MHERRKALGGYYLNRDLQKARFRDWERARDAASLAKWTAVNDLANQLERFTTNFERNGGVVHWARDAAEARAIILKIAADANAKAIVKSKCMTSEEIHLNDALEKAGYGVVESDLGEFIQQLRGEAPYHFVFPCMHVKREAISEAQSSRGYQASAGSTTVPNRYSCSAEIGMMPRRRPGAIIMILSRRAGGRRWTLRQTPKPL